MRNLADGNANPDKTTLVDNDAFVIRDSETSPDSLKEILWSSIKTALSAFFALLSGATFTGDVVGSSAALYGFKGKQNVQTDSYTTVDSDNGKVIIMNKATAVTLTIHAAAPADFNCLVVQKGAGQITIAASGGNVRNQAGHTKTGGQYSAVSIYVESNAGTAPEVYLFGGTST